MDTDRAGSRLVPRAARRGQTGSLVALVASTLLLLGTRESRAAECDAARAVTLDIASDGPASDTARVKQHVITELGASKIGVCVALLQPLAHVQIRAALPDWRQASIRIDSAGTPSLERALDVSSLPPETRASAIASATDELLRSALAAAHEVNEPALPPAASSVEPDRPPPARPRAGRSSAPPETLPLVEAGLAATASSYMGQRQALGADFFARIWLLPRLPLSARLGRGDRTSRPRDRGNVQPDEDMHGALGVGFELLPDTNPLSLIGEAGLRISRVGFDERVTLRPDEEAVFDAFPSANQSLDEGWALAASLGIEGTVRQGPIGISLALAGLMPLMPAESDLGDTRSLDAIGAEVRIGVGVVLASRAR